MFKCLADEGSSDIKLVDLNSFIARWIYIRIKDITSRLEALKKGKNKASQQGPIYHRPRGAAAPPQPLHSYMRCLISFSKKHENPLPYPPQIHVFTNLPPSFNVHLIMYLRRV